MTGRFFIHLSLGLLLSLKGFAQFDPGIYHGDTVNYTDASGKKQGLWIVTGIMDPSSLYSDTAVIEKGYYLDNRKNGQWLEYYQGGQLKSDIIFVNGQPNGSVKMYFESGNLSEEGIWKGGHWVGQYKFYYETGCLRQCFNFNAGGKREGKQYYYYEKCGRLMMEVEMKEGDEVAYTSYEPDGSISKTYNQQDGVVEYTKKGFVKPEINPEPHLAVNNPPTKITPDNCNGYVKLYNSDRQLIKDGYYINCHLKDGKELVYNKDGQLAQIKVYKDFKYIGDLPTSSSIAYSPTTDYESEIKKLSEMIIKDSTNKSLIYELKELCENYRAQKPSDWKKHKYLDGDYSGNTMTDGKLYIYKSDAVLSRIILFKDYTFVGDGDAGH